MNKSERRFVPGQIATLRLKRGSMIVALDGALRLAIRDDTLSWLCSPTPCLSVALEEGQSHVMHADAPVQIEAAGAMPVSGLIVRSSTPAVAWIRRWRAARWLMPIRG